MRQCCGRASRPQAGTWDARLVIHGALFGLAFKALGSFFGLLKGTLEGAAILGQRVVYVGGDVSVALLGVGLIVRFNIAALIFSGGAFGWLIALPLLGLPPNLPSDPVDAAYTIWSQQVRYIGVGAMVVAGLAAIVRVRAGLIQALRTIVGKVRPDSAADQSAQGQDLGVTILSSLAIGCVTLIGVIYFFLTAHVPVALTATGIMLVAAFFFTAVASYIVGLVGNSNSPVSGMTITTVLVTGLMLLLFGFSGTTGMFATLGVAAVVCCTACTAGDVCNDLKTGQLVGASPRRQQLMQIAGVGVAALVMAPVLQLLHDYTPGGIGGKELAAPQAQLFASLAQGFFGTGQLPWKLVGIGAGIGIGLVGLDRLLSARQTSFRAYPMPIAVGMYLPVGLSVPIFLGGILSVLLARHEGDQPSRPSVLLASGAIAGESLMGVGIALLASLGVSRLDLILSHSIQTRFTVVAVVATLFFFYWRPRSSHQ